MVHSFWECDGAHFAEPSSDYKQTCTDSEWSAPFKRGSSKFGHLKLELEKHLEALQLLDANSRPEPPKAHAINQATYFLSLPLDAPCCSLICANRFSTISQSKGTLRRNMLADLRWKGVAILASRPFLMNM